MAELAIDPTEIRPAGPTRVEPARSRRPLLIAGGALLGFAVIGGAGAALVSNLSIPSSLSGLAFLPKPDEPRRSEIRIGRLPDMPEIRDGVPAIVGTQPVRVVETAPPPPPIVAQQVPTGPRPVAAMTIPAASVATAPLPSNFTTGRPHFVGTSQPMAFSPAGRIQPVPVAAEPPPAEPQPAMAALPPGPRPAEAQPPAAAELARLTREPPKPEPASTASVAETVVPLPPRAPARMAAARPPEARPVQEARPERPAPRPAQLAARPPAAQPVAAPAPEGAVQPVPPPDDRIEFLGMKLPNGRDLQNAVSSIGDALSLPKSF
ncbi:hypothetical protein [Enterovirga sp. CN4-39]|uniref:hypothetical protein n=1 Tax=Enterovirga sp. CN4-39 TaxID=3400910 RepID=UPI003C08C9CD